MDASVLIAGAGPVGLTLAMALKRRGIGVRIVDKAAQPTDKSKALVLWPRTLELLDVQGCVQPFLDAGMRATGARLFGSSRTLAHVPFDTARSPYPFALMIPQSDTERLLAAELARLDVTIERQVELMSFADDGAGVTAVLRHADGREESVRVDWLAGCDGAHSTVRHGLAAHFEGSTLPSDWVLADVEIDGDLPRHELTICWSPDGVLVFFPIAGARYRVVADVGLADPTATAAPPPTLAQAQALIDQRGPAGLRAHDPIWMSHFRINERKVHDYRQGRVFLAGDAAHIHSPAGGQGMNTGMQDAFNLAWKLALVLEGAAAPGLLDSYSPERSAIGEQVLRNAGTMTKVALMRNPVLQQIRGLAAGVLSHVPMLRQRLVDQLTEVDLHYRDSPLTRSPGGAARHPAGGERAPDLVLTAAAGPRRLHDLLRGGRFVLLAVGAPAPALPQSLGALATVAEAEPTADYDAGHVFLIRPDAYVAMSTQGGDTDALMTALQRLAN